MVFTITNPAPSISTITPSSGVNTGSVSITNLAGSGFINGTTVTLTKTGQSNITANSVSVSLHLPRSPAPSRSLGAQAGSWNIVVTNPDGQSATKVNGFTITYPAPTITTITSVFSYEHWFSKYSEPCRYRVYQWFDGNPYEDRSAKYNRNRGLCSLIFQDPLYPPAPRCTGRSLEYCGYESRWSVSSEIKCIYDNKSCSDSHFYYSLFCGEYGLGEHSEPGRYRVYQWFNGNPNEDRSAKYYCK